MKARNEFDRRSLRGKPAVTPRGRLDAPARKPAPPAEEALIVDARCQVRPAQQVEAKLFTLLKTAFGPAAQVRLRSLCRERGGP
jgi:hypothetical protein